MTEEDLDTESLVFRQLDRVMRTASLDLDNFIESSGTQHKLGKDTDTWSHRVLMSAMFFDSFLMPLKTEEEQKQVKQAYDNVDPEEETGNDFMRMFRAKALFEENVKILHKNNMVFQSNDDLVIEDQSPGNLEPNNSDVEEEVVE